MSNYEGHSFYCMQCGNKGIDLMRKTSRQRNKHHRKKMYCPYCKCEVNHVECRNDQEVKEFKEAFAAGEYREEAQQSIEYIKKENLIWSW